MTSWKTAVHPRVAKVRELLASRIRNANEAASNKPSTASNKQSTTKIYWDGTTGGEEVRDYLKAPEWEKTETRRLLPYVTKNLQDNLVNQKKGCLVFSGNVKDGLIELVKTSGSFDAAFMHYVKDGDGDRDVQRFEILVWVLLFRNQAGPQLHSAIDRAVKENGSLRLRFTDLPFVEIKDARADDFIGVYVIVFGGYFCYVGKTDDGFWSRTVSHRQGDGNWKLKPVKDSFDFQEWQHGIAIGFDSHASHYRGRVVAGLETILISLLDSTNNVEGMNYNIVDAFGYDVILCPDEVKVIIRAARAYADDHGRLPGISDLPMWERVVLGAAHVKAIVEKVSIGYVTSKVIMGWVWSKTWLQEDGPALRQFLPRQVLNEVDSNLTFDGPGPLVRAKTADAATVDKVGVKTIGPSPLTRAKTVDATADKLAAEFGDHTRGPATKRRKRSTA